MKCLLSPRRGVTLIELLVVMAIILLLMTILLPAINALRKAAKRTDSRADVAMITSAFKQYFNEYQCWPTNLQANGWDRVSAQPDNASTNSFPMQSNVLGMLSGLNIEGNNPRLTAFLHPNPRGVAPDGSYKDPWGNVYKYMCDFNNDGMVNLGYTNLVEAGVSVWSMGPDKKDENEEDREDDLSSWN